MLPANGSCNLDERTAIAPFRFWVTAVAELKIRAQ
jgi:hypothetical protein